MTCMLLTQFQTCDRAFVGDQYVTMVSNRYHHTCYNCVRCSQRLVPNTGGNYFQLGDLHCRNCYIAEYGKKCRACFEYIEGVSITLPGTGRKYHEGCFCCADCGAGVAFLDGEDLVCDVHMRRRKPRSSAPSSPEQEMINMGFPLCDVQTALEITGGQLDPAVEFLLTGGSAAPSPGPSTSQATSSVASTDSAHQDQVEELSATMAGLMQQLEMERVAKDQAEAEAAQAIVAAEAARIEAAQAAKAAEAASKASSEDQANICGICYEVRWCWVMEQ